MIFFEVILPVFMIFAIGFIGQKTIGFDVKALSKMAMYLLSPVLVFRTFYVNEFSSDHFYIIIYCCLLCFSLIIFTYFIAWVRKYSKSETCGLILSSSFMNNGNYGTPVALLLFGTVGFEYAIVLMVIQSLLMATVGVYYAAKGSPANDGIRSALMSVVKMPIMYGAVTGLFFQWLSVPVSRPIMQAVHLVADATIPVIMVILGMQLAKITIRTTAKEKLLYALSIKLIVSPFIAFLFTLVLPVDPMIKQLMIIMAAMPAAANTTMYALEFNTEPEFVSSATLVSTLLTLFTLPLMFWLVL
ncbi:AEC family transporter [Sutcliffiella horikoshii]|uniref:AEC family transporter n=1 Tax=Sutcliffiella horikoshii TaxID=79883 RepID=A0A5D4SNC1_9BACI|nr:AEC family transporter [Sutcliffiella horikoshii]TYS64529.1 AEC family transporter [Sutcliffiella horikoshii]